MKAFYHNLRAVYGPRDTGSIPVRCSDGTTLITDREGILSRWAEHFHGVLNQPSTFDPSVLDAIPDWDTAHACVRACVCVRVFSDLFAVLSTVFNMIRMLSSCYFKIKVRRVRSVLLVVANERFTHTHTRTRTRTRTHTHTHTHTDATNKQLHDDFSFTAVSLYNRDQSTMYS